MTDEIRHFPQDRGITRVALMRGDEELSRTLVVPMTIRIGRAILRMDGIGDVATPEEHRNRGHSRRVLEAAVTFMSTGDAVLSTLYGIPRFYPKYGYATLGPEPGITLRSLDEHEMPPDGHDVRPGTLGDLAAIQRLYRDETAHATGALVREDDWWTWGELEQALQPDAGEVRVIVRGRKIVGYAWKASTCWWMRHWQRDQPDTLGIGEAFAADHEAAEAVLAACRRWGQEGSTRAATLNIPATGHVGAAACLQNVDVIARYSDDAEFMGRSTGSVALLRALQPELDARWRAVSAWLPPFAVTLVTDGERATVRGDEQGVTVQAGGEGDVEVVMDPGNLARLALGGFEPEHVLERLGVPAAVRPPLAALFPRQVPYIYPVDRF